MAVQQVQDQRLRDMASRMMQVDDLEKTFASILDQMKEVKKDIIKYGEEIEKLKPDKYQAEALYRKTSLWPTQMRVYVPFGRAFILTDVPTIRKKFEKEMSVVDLELNALKTKMSLAEYNVTNYVTDMREIANENRRLRFEITKIDENVFGSPSRKM